MSTEHQITPEMIRAMTHEQRVELASHMIQPFRCGGLTYIDGVPPYRCQGWLIPASVIAQSQADHNGDPWPGIREYQATHEPYTKG